VVPDAAREPACDPGPLVSVVVPARNEERAVGQAVRSLRAQQYRRLEVVVVDDDSSDATAARASEAAGDDPRVRVVAGTPPPPGWIGKSWACWEGAQASRGEWILFTDADVVHAPESLGRALALARRLGRGGLTLAPRVVTGSLAERVVMPAAIACINAFVAPGPLARSPRSPVGLAAGAFILLERSLYDRVGGHRAVADRMVDDLALAARVKRAGGLLVPGDGTEVLSLRMYHGARDMWRGWRKNAAFGTEGSATKGLAGGLLLGTLAVAPGLALAGGLGRGDRAAVALGLAGLAAQSGLQRTAGRIVPTRRTLAPTLPLGTLVIAAAAVRGAVDRLSGRGPEWRGRRYPFAR
jgi:hypothetical protein